MKKLPADEYAAGMPDFHVRTAEKLYDMCCANKGTYIKVGQHIGKGKFIKKGHEHFLGFSIGDK